MRFIIFVLDSVGIGALPDAAAFGDEGADTLGNIYKQRGRLHIPNLISLGLGNIQQVNIPAKTDKPTAAYGKCAELIPSKDTTGGHWEIAGLILQEPFPTFPDGFPPRITDEFTRLTGLEILGNVAASGTEIIQRLGGEHVRTGKPIVYTSADSVFQVAAHEDVIPLERLYEICEISRRMLTGADMVGRVIARPFIGSEGNYERTKNRKDFSVQPPGDTILDAVKNAGMQVAAVGKIDDIFAYRGITTSNHSTSNDDGVLATIEYLKQDFDGLLFANLVDFDMLYGHRNNVEGYAACLEQLDSQLPEVLAALKPDDILVITADHGCDPTMASSTDHSREYIPLLVYGEGVRPVDLGIRSSFSDIAATAVEYLGLGKWNCGESFLGEILGS